MDDINCYIRHNSMKVIVGMTRFTLLTGWSPGVLAQLPILVVAPIQTSFKASILLRLSGTSVLNIYIYMNVRPAVLPRLVWELGLTYWSLLHSTIHFRMDTRHSKPFFLRVSSYTPNRNDQHDQGLF